MDYARVGDTRAKALRGNMDTFLAFSGRGVDAPITMTEAAGTF